MNVRSSFLGLLLLLSASVTWASGAYAGQMVEVFRAMLESQTSEMTKGVAPRAYKIAKSNCGLLFAKIKGLHEKYSCSGRCDEKIKAYDVALIEHWLVSRALSLKLKPETYRNGASPVMGLRICFRIAVNERDHIATYGVGRMLSQSAHYDDRFLGGVWAYTSLELGRGVPKSKRKAGKRLTELYEAEDANVKSKRFLFSLIGKEKSNK